MRRMWSNIGMGGEHHRYYKLNKFRQNPRGDPKFLVDLTRNDPCAINQFLQIQSHNYMLSLNHYIVLLHYKTTSIHIVHNCYSATVHVIRL